MTNSTFQNRVASAVALLGTPDERRPAQHFLEEAIELFQATGGAEWEVDALKRRIFAKPADPVHIEVGSVIFTLADLCTEQGVDMMAEGERDLKHVERSLEIIRARLLAKPPLERH